MLVVFETISTVPEITDHTEDEKVRTPKKPAQLIANVRFVESGSLMNGSDLVPVGI